MVAVSDCVPLWSTMGGCLLLLWGRWYLLRSKLSSCYLVFLRLSVCLSEDWWASGCGCQGEGVVSDIEVVKKGCDISLFVDV